MFEEKKEKYTKNSSSFSNNQSSSQNNNLFNLIRSYKNILLIIKLIKQFIFSNFI